MIVQSSAKVDSSELSPKAFANKSVSSIISGFCLQQRPINLNVIQIFGVVFLDGSGQTDVVPFPTMITNPDMFLFTVQGTMVSIAVYEFQGDKRNKIKLRMDFSIGMKVFNIVKVVKNHEVRCDKSNVSKLF